MDVKFKQCDNCGAEINSFDDIFRCHACNEWIDWGWDIVREQRNNTKDSKGINKAKTIWEGIKAKFHL